MIRRRSSACSQYRPCLPVRVPVVRHLTGQQLAEHDTEAVHVGLEPVFGVEAVGVHPLGPHRSCSPRHVIPFNSRNKGLQC